MPQSPSDGQPEELIKKFIGLDDIDDSVARKKGSVTAQTNFIDDQQWDASRRQGRDFDFLDNGNPVQLIYPLVWDDGSVSVITDAGGTMKYEPFKFSKDGLANQLDNPNTPGPMPNGPSWIKFWKFHGKIIDLTSLMRALSDASRFSTGSDFTPFWRKNIYAFDIYEVTEDGSHRVAQQVIDKATILDYQAKGFGLRPVLATTPVSPDPTNSNNGTNIKPDFYYADYLASSQGLAISDLNTIITNYNSTLIYYLKTFPIEGAATVVNYGGGDIFNGIPTNANLDLLTVQVGNLINEKLIRVKVVAHRAAYSILSSSQIEVDWSLDVPFPSPSTACMRSKIAAWTPVIGRDTAQTVNGSCTIVTSGEFAITETMVFALFYEQDYSFPNFTMATIQIRAWTGYVEADLSAYPANSGTASVYVKYNLFGTIPVYPPPHESGPGVFGQIAGSPQLGSAFAISNLMFPVSNPGVPPSGITGNFSDAHGWYIPIGAGENKIFVLTRNASYQATVPGTIPMFPVITPDEFFLPQGDLLCPVGSQTDILWGQSKLSGSGGASRSYPAGSLLGDPQPYPPSPIVRFDGAAPGFNAARFHMPYYRPTILLIAQISVSNTSTIATSLTIRLYIDNTLVRTTSGVPVSGGNIYYAFSVKDLGDFTSQRPPDNNPADDLNGWPVPNVRIAVEPIGGDVTVLSSSKLEDYVVNYPV